ncbi:hypothetical protein CLV49_0471 [Labedella gwakjiensis]|uniref:Multidrug transporter n=1 Tax=Labedella gwakjiensis TaxID=390269 RepID=A0A2P8GSC2_9MICO|nr:multidrug transporter [Labedella gwakjiensis]PSL36869.1 hypothetical protein CLV49_0471 [Labedella gwakjiensis]RUQ84367.1 multidrug transporter [Labedella gwakjiensis]
MSEQNQGEPSHDEKRHEQLTRAEKSTEADAAPRIEVTEKDDGVTRIDVSDQAAVRPGEREESDGS